MANRRMIAGDLFEDEFIGSLNFLERLLWIGIITTVADDQGRMIDNPALIRSKVFLFDKVMDCDIESTLRKINAANKIARYVVGNKSLIQIVNWWKYQTPAWASPSKYPAPEGWTDRAKYHAAGNKIITVNWDKIGGYVANYVAPLHSPIEDGDGDGDVKGDGEGEGKIAPPLAPFDILQCTLEQEGILVVRASDIQVVSEMVEAGITQEDLVAGISWKKDNSDGKPLFPSSVIGPAKTAMRIRLQQPAPAKKMERYHGPVVLPNGEVVQV